MPNWWNSTEFFGMQSVDGRTNGDIWIGSMVFYGVFVLFAALVLLVGEVEGEGWRYWTIAILLTPIAPVVIVVALTWCLSFLSWSVISEVYKAWRPHD